MNAVDRQAQSSKLFSFAPVVDHLPVDLSILSVVDLNKLSKATRVVVVRCLGVAKSLERPKQEYKNKISGIRQQEEERR